MCWYSNVGGGFTGRSTGWAGCTTNVLILSCDVVSDVRSNGQVFRLVSLECQGCDSVRAGLVLVPAFGSTFLWAFLLDDRPPDSNALSDRFGASREEVGAPVEEAGCVSSIYDPMSDTGEGEVVRRIDTPVNMAGLMISML